MPEGPPSLREAPIGYDYLWATLVGVAYLGVRVGAGGRVLLETTSASTRSALYISLATTSGALLGFAITAVTVVLTIGGGRRIDWLYADRRFAYVRKVFLGAIHALGIATLYFSTLIVIDTHTHGQPVLEAVSATILVLVLLRVFHIIRLLDGLLDIAIQDQQDKASGTPPSNPRFTSPVDDELSG